jgi:hypothetical protein
LKGKQELKKEEGKLLFFTFKGVISQLEKKGGKEQRRKRKKEEEEEEVQGTKPNNRIH